MRLQVIDPNTNFECNSCTRCCEQPWRTLIEPEKVEALDKIDWASEFPSTKGRTLYRKVREGAKTVVELGKGEGVKCVFLDGDGLCMIHKKLGYDAKPNMCKQFPFLSAMAWDADYVSANFGCKAVQRSSGRPMTEQQAAITATVPLHKTPAKPDAKFVLSRDRLVPPDAADGLLALLGDILGQDGPSSIFDRLAEVLATVEQAVQIEPDRLADAVRSGDVRQTPEPRSYEPFASPTAAPMQSRFLFAATMFPDALPADSTGNMGFLKRITLVPKLMSLAQIRGTYASRLLDRNVAIADVLTAAAKITVTPAATALLGRYLRSRMWQRFPGGTKLPLYSAIHQHILDVNAVVFYGAAGAIEAGKDCLDREIIEHALMLVEFHLSNQPRLYDQVLKGWLRGWLATPTIAWSSLRMIRTAGRTCAAPEESPATDNARA